MRMSERKNLASRGFPTTSLLPWKRAMDASNGGVKQAGQTLVDQGYALAEDLDIFEKQGKELYDALSSGVKLPA